jgi:hypothetical protein
LFDIIFPSEQDIEFIEDLVERIGEDRLQSLCAQMWDCPIEKTLVSGIHGTLFYGLRDAKRQFYPNKRFYDNVYGFSALQRRKFGIATEP